jgi:hypothetical protein
MMPVRSAELLAVAGRIVKPSERAIADPYKLVAHVLVYLNLSGIREALDRAARRLRQTLGACLDSGGNSGRRSA